MTNKTKKLLQNKKHELGQLSDGELFRQFESRASQLKLTCGGSAPLSDNKKRALRAVIEAAINLSLCEG